MEGTNNILNNLFNLPEIYYGGLLFVLYVLLINSYLIGIIKKKITLIFLATTIVFIIALSGFSIIFAILSALVFLGFASFTFIYFNMHMKFSKFAFWSGIIASLIIVGLYIFYPSLLLGDMYEYFPNDLK